MKHNLRVQTSSWAFGWLPTVRKRGLLWAKTATCSCALSHRLSRGNQWSGFYLLKSELSKTLLDGEIAHCCVFLTAAPRYPTGWSVSKLMKLLRVYCSFSSKSNYSSFYLFFFFYLEDSPIELGCRNMNGIHFYNTPYLVFNSSSLQVK